MNVPGVAVVRLVCLLLACLLHPAAAAAQQRLIRIYDQQQGLAVPFVTSLAQDAAGFLWIGTVAGLVRYDGSDMRSWGRAELTGAVRELQGKGRLVVVRDDRDAVYSVRPNGLVPLLGPDGRPVIGVSAMTIDEDGTLWVLWPDRMARLSISGQWRRESAPPLDPGDRLQLLRTGRGVLLVGSQRRVWRRRADGQFDRLFDIERPTDLLIRGPDDFVVVGWVGESTLRLMQRYAGATDVLLELRSRRPFSVAERGGALWVSYDRGVAMLRPGEPPEIIEAARGVTGGGPLLVDREGSVWLGSPHGLMQFPEPETVTWNESNGLPSTYAQFVIVERGVVWVSTSSGLSGVPARPTPGRAFEAQAQISGRICRTSDGRLVATDTRGRWYQLQGESWARVGWPDGAVASDCAASDGGPTWFATSRGLYRLSPGGAAPERVQTSDQRLNAVHTDSAGRIWTGAGERVCRRATADGRRLKDEGWACTNLAGAGDILDFITVPGGLWAATRNGVWVYHDAGWRPVQSSWELPSRFINGFAESPSGGVWVLSAGAVIRVVPEPLTPQRWRVLERLSTWQGVQTEEGNGLVESTDGTVWLVSSVGLTRVPIAARRIRRDPPLVEISNVMVNGLEVPVGEPHRLSVPDAVVELRFAVLTYRDRSRLQTQLQLTPESPWSPPSTGVPQFRLSQLAPGGYAAAVRASIDGERWSRPSAPVAFTVPAPWYRRPSLLLLGALLLAGTLLVAHRTRTAVLLGLERQRTAIAMDLHDELGAGLGSIGILAGVASRPDVADGERRDFAQRIALTAGELGGKLTDIVGALRSGRVTLGVLAADLAERAARLVPGPHPSLHMDYPQQWPEGELDPAVRHDLRLIALEAVHNAVRHADARTITLGIQPAGRHWRMWVKDDGIGFDPNGDAAPRGTGLGQRALKRRAERIRASLKVDSTPGRGTTVEILFEPHRPRMMM
ncbi:MAG TPA: two-component regulator propeller domain-containing protein [Gemmatimonadales bacterium]